MIIRFLSLFLLTSVLTSFSPVPNDTEKECALSVEIKNVRNKDGVLYVFLYNYENQYPDNPYKHLTIDKSNIVNERILINLNGLAPGRYAVSILDDENINEDMDFFLGIPTEGYGFSNNVRPWLSLPDYSDLLIDLNEVHKKINISLHYIL
ncbi:MAG: DUF2141 domain-containing protein [Flavobacteriales bacterium]|nr:DUF2141 domain-containing protein [Flavobacteriales bacterium]